MNYTNICCIFDQAAHYSAPIYKLMDKRLHCDFYITKWKVDPFKQMNYNDLDGFKKASSNTLLFNGFYWQNGTVHLAFKPYKQYLMNGHPYSVSSWVLLILIRILGKKVYFWSHGWYGRETKIKKMIKKIYFSLSTKTCVYSEYARDLMIKEGIHSNKLFCIYNSLDFDKQYNIRQKLKHTDIYKSYFKNDHPVLLYIGRIQKNKKINLLIEALNILNKEGHYNLIIIGKESENTGIYSQIADCNLKNQVWLYGECYDEEQIGELIYNADLSVSPGNIGLMAMHSLAYGTPIITHNNFAYQGPEFESIKEGMTGDFFMEDSIPDLCNKIKFWTSLSVNQREDIRTKCYEIIDNKYNPNIQIQILLNELK
jgi:glycosyltransferase involved in cell wall biosynthesis